MMKGEYATAAIAPTERGLGSLISSLDAHIDVAQSILDGAISMADQIGGTQMQEASRGDKAQPPDGGPLTLRLNRRLETLAHLQTRIQNELSRAAGAL